MNKLLFLIILFVISRAAIIITASYTEGALASFVGCVAYVLLFCLFSPREKYKKTPLGIRKSILVVSLFVFLSNTLSSLINFFFEINSGDISLMQGLVAILFVPVAEELFFRATVFKTLDTLVTPTSALFLSSLIFSLSHAGIPSIAVSFVLGGILAWIYKKTGSILLPVICHSVNNFLAFVLLKGF